MAKVAAGATWLQLYSALVYQGPSLIGDIKRALLRAVEREGAAHIQDLVGRNAETWARA